MKILLTGGAGFIGSHICDYLIENGHFVRVIDNLITGNKNNLIHHFKNDNFEFFYGDITNLESVRKACIGIDVICHQAAIGSVPRSIDDPLISHNNNINGFLNILIGAKENNIKRIVYASSSAVYGDNEDLPKSEDKIGNPLSPYAITKYVDELYGNMFTKLYNMECIGLRYFNVFGPRQDPNGAYAAVIPKFISSLKNNQQPIINGDGKYSRDFTYVNNIVMANYLALTTSNNECFGQIFNIGAGGRITILEMYNSIKNILNSNLDPIFGTFRKGDIPHSNASIEKANKLLGYDPIISFDEGIKLTINYYKLF
jgi:UDP-N-acetylglucosamine 4-epimerase